MAWQQLIDIAHEAAANVEAEQARTPADCPDCGTALRAGSSGVLFCPWDGWRADG